MNSVLVMLTPTAMTHPTKVAKAVIEVYEKPAPPLTCWMGEGKLPVPEKHLRKLAFPGFHVPETAVELLYHHLHLLPCKRSCCCRKPIIQPQPALREAEGAKMLTKRWFSPGTTQGCWPEMESRKPFCVPSGHPGCTDHGRTHPDRGICCWLNRSASDRQRRWIRLI